MATCTEVAPAVRTDVQGQFLLQPVPTGLFKLMADGGTAKRPGTWPTLDFDIHTVSGQDNKLGMPVYLPQLNPDNRLCVNDTTFDGEHRQGANVACLWPATAIRFDDPAGWHGSGNPGQSGSAGTCAPCQQCQGSSCVPVTDSPAFGPPNPVQIPSVNLLARDAVAMRRFGANELSDPEVTASCTQICVGGNQRFRLEGDVTARDWEIEVYADMQYPNCAKARRTSVNIQRTTTHELKHGRFLADAMNVWKRRFGSVFSSRAECESAARASINDFRNVWGAVLARQANHADFVGEQRYGFDCVNGTTVEVPLGVTY